MRIYNIIVLSSFIISCNNPEKAPTIHSKTENTKADLQDSIFTTEIIKNVADTSIINFSTKSIDILFNGANNYFGGKRNPKLNFDTECMMCEPVQAYKQGFLFGKRLYVTKDSVLIYQSDRDISDTTGLINTKGYYGERDTKKYLFSSGKLVMKYQGQSCNDADYVSVKLLYNNETITLNKIINASFFEYDLDNNEINEQYILGTRNCSQELILLRVNDSVKN